MTRGEQSGRAAYGRLDLVCGAVLACASLYLFLDFVPTYAPGEGGAGKIAPSFIPRMALGVMFVCSLLVAIGGLRSKQPGPSSAGRRITLEIVGWACFATVLILLLLYAGFLVAGGFAILSGCALTRYRRRPVLIGAMALLLPLFLDWSVWKLFWIELP